MSTTESPKFFQDENNNQDNTWVTKSEKSHQIKTKLKDKWVIIKRKLENKKFEDFLQNRDLNTFLELFSNNKNMKRCLEIIRKIVVSELWKFEFDGLLFFDPFKECLRFNKNLEIINKIEINNCEYFYFKNINQMIFFLEMYFQTKQKSFLSKVEQLIKNPCSEYLESLKKKYDHPEFNFNIDQESLSKETLINKFINLTLENHNKLIPSNLKFFKEYISGMSSEVNKIFWGSIEYDFENKQIGIEITKENANYQKVSQFLKTLCLVFGMRTKSTNIKTSKYFIID
jgi:hypothetical protein